MSVILATAGYDHKIRFWEAPSGVCSRILRYPDSQVNCLEITPDKQFLAAGGNPHIRLFEISHQSNDNNNNSYNSNNNPASSNSSSSGNTQQQQQQQQQIISKESSQNQQQAQPQVNQQDVTNNMNMRPNNNQTNNNNNNNNVVAGNPSTGTGVQNPNNPNSGGGGVNQNPVLTCDGHRSSVTSIGFQRDGRWMFSGSEDGTVKIWDLRSSQFQRSFNSGAPVTSVALHPNQTQIISGDQNGSVKIWDLVGASTARSTGIGIKQAASATTTGDYNKRNRTMQQQAAAVNNNQKNRGISTIQNNHSPSPINELVPDAHASSNTSTSSSYGYSSGGGACAPIQSVDISEDGRIVMAASNHGDVFIWNPSLPSNAATFNNPHLKHPDPSSGSLNNHENIVMNSNDNREMANLIPVTKFRAHPRGSYLLHAKLSPDCTQLVTTSSDRTARLWNTQTWDCIQILGGHNKWVWCGVFSADSSYLVTGSSDHWARLWNLRTGEVVRTYTGHQSAVTCVALNDSST